MAFREKHFVLCPLGSGAVRPWSAAGFLRFLSGFSLASFCLYFPNRVGGKEAA